MTTRWNTTSICHGPTWKSYTECMAAARNIRSLPPARGVPRNDGLGRVESKYLRSQSRSRTPILRLRRNMAKATGKKQRETREEAIPNMATSYHMWASSGSKGHQARAAGQAPDHPESLRAVEKRNVDTAHNEGYVAGVFDRARLAAPYDGYRLGQANRQTRGPQKKIDATAHKTITVWADNSPTKYGFAAGT